MAETNRIQQVYTHAYIKCIYGVPLVCILMKVLRGECCINGWILKVLFQKRLWCAQIFRTYTTLCNHDAKTLSASPKYEAMERLIFSGNRFSYNMERVPNEVISIVISLAENGWNICPWTLLWILQCYSCILRQFLIVSLQCGQDLRKAKNFQINTYHIVKKGCMLSVYGLLPLFFRSLK